MQAYASTVRAFLTGSDIRVTAEPVIKGYLADWRVEMDDCSVIIEEKAVALPFWRKSMVGAGNQLAAARVSSRRDFHILWLNGSASPTININSSDEIARALAIEELLQKLSSIDGVVVAQEDDAKVQATLSVNHHSRRGPLLASSLFAKRLYRPRYFPIEFPTDIVPGIVSGAQPKLLLRQSADGRYSSPKRSQYELNARLALAADIVEQLGQYFARKKSENPDWTNEKNLERIRRGLQAKAIDGKWPFTQEEQRWIMARLRELCDIAN